MSEPAFQPLDFTRLPESEMRARARAFFDLVSTRRSVRHFSPEPIPLDVVETAIHAAAQAPSGANQQPWRFVLVTAPALKRRIREAAEAEERENYSRRFPDEWLHALAPLGTNWEKPFLETAPCLIVVFRIDYGLENGQKRKHYYVQESVGLACGFLLAALHAAGLATLTHTPSPMGFLGRILDRPENERPYLLIPVGFPVEDACVPALQRKALDDILVRR
jgi:iodotyrosine deiodinase